ncbi:hypothetical protein D3C76_1108330 [compost metagenome]
MDAAGPVVAIVPGGGVVELGGGQRCAEFGLPAIVDKGPGDAGVELVVFLVVLARLGEGDGIVL